MVNRIFRNINLSLLIWSVNLANVTFNSIMMKLAYCAKAKNVVFM